MSKLLVKLFIPYPYGNYSGPTLFEYQIIDKYLYKKIKKYCKIYSNQKFYFFSGEDFNCTLDQIKFESTDDPLIIKDYNQLFFKQTEIIMVNSSLDILHLILQCIYSKSKKLENVDIQNISTQQIIQSLEKILSEQI